MQTQLTIAIAGATGAVGREMLACLAQRTFPHASLRLFASERSAGTTLPFMGRDIRVEALTGDALKGVDIALFSAGSSITRDLAPAAAKHNCIIIDNSSAFRMDPKVPLIIPEVNPLALQDSSLRPFVPWSLCPFPIIANPNCSTIILLMALTPLRSAFGIERAVVSTYQAASGAGAKGMDELEEQTRADLRGESSPPAPKVFHEPYAFNLFSHNTAIDPLTGLNTEETKVILETRKIWSEESLPAPQRTALTVTCIRVPVRRAHAESVNITLRREATARQLRAALAAFPGVQIVDDHAKNDFPTPLKAGGKGDVLVGRIRPDASRIPPDALAALAKSKGSGGLDDVPCIAFDLFICGDQLLKGAALNAVQIAELLIR